MVEGLSKRVVLICDPIAPEAVELLKNRGFEVRFAKSPPPAELARIVAGVDALIVRSATKVTREVIDAADRLSVIARAGAGLDNIDVEYAKLKGIHVVNAADAVSNAVAELTICLIISLLRKVPHAYSSLKAGKWEKKLFLGEEIEGKILGVLGLGRIGRLVATKAKALGMRVIAYKRHGLIEAASSIGVEPAKSLDDLLASSEVLTIHVPLTPLTYHMVGRRELELLPDGAYLVNTSRGAVVDGRALLEMLEKGKVAGAALDVYEHEPPAEEWEWRLIRHPNVIATPHIGAMTRQAQRKAGIIVARAIAEILGGTR